LFVVVVTLVLRLDCSWDFFVYHVTTLLPICYVCSRLILTLRYPTISTVVARDYVVAHCYVDLITFVVTLRYVVRWFFGWLRLFAVPVELLLVVQVVRYALPDYHIA